MIEYKLHIQNDVQNMYQSFNIQAFNLCLKNNDFINQIILAYLINNI
jgi:hypothetical protein